MANVEIFGRLLLWQYALKETHDSLKIGIRAESSIGFPAQADNQLLYDASCGEYIQNHPDYKKGPPFAEITNEFDDAYYGPFPNTMDCWLVRKICVEKAAVNFCQIIIPGNAQSGSAAQNSPAFVNTHLDELKERVFHDQVELHKFEELCKKLRHVRDKMIGHADASAFEIKHEDSLSSLRGTPAVLQEIDIAFWFSCVKRLIEALNSYAANYG